MNTLLAARAQMEVSLAFHMVFAAVGIGMPLLLVISEAIFLRTGEALYRELAQRWAKITAILFAIGAVSGTALSLELGLLWPRFMAFAGSAIGPAFALEGYAFFIEAIFVGLYLYGWRRLTPFQHWLTGIPVAVSGLASGVIVTAANAWMQTPGGIVVEHGRITSLDAAAAFRSPAWLPMALHSSLSCYISVGFAVAGAAAWAMLKGRAEPHHRAALKIAMSVAAIAAVLQGASGDLIARMVADYQPVKLAAMEAHYETSRGAAIVLGGIPDDQNETVKYGIEIPYGLSILAHHDPNAEIRGLKSFPRAERPNTAVVHMAFDIMVGIGSWLIAVGMGYFFCLIRKIDVSKSRRMLRVLVVTSPLGFVALEAGWVVTEAGRQPWTVYGLLRTRDAVTTAQGVTATLFVFSALYVALGCVVVALLTRIARSPLASPAEDH